MLVILLFSNSGLITGWWEPLATEQACKFRQAQVEFQGRQQDTKGTITVAECAKPFDMKGWIRQQ